MTLSFGRVTVTEQVHAYQRKRLPDHEVIDLNGVDLPPHSFTTQALWYELGEDLLDEFPHEVLLGALHAAEHTQIAVLPLLAMCDRWDIGGLSTNFHPQTGAPDDLHLRRAPGRRRDHAAGLSQLRRARRRTRTGSSASARASRAARRACSRPSAATSTSRCPRPGALEVMGRMLQQ